MYMTYPLLCDDICGLSVRLTGDTLQLGGGGSSFYGKTMDSDPLMPSDEFDSGPPSAGGSGPPSVAREDDDLSHHSTSHDLDPKVVPDRPKANGPAPVAQSSIPDAASALGGSGGLGVNGLERHSNNTHINNSNHNPPNNGGNGTTLGGGSSFGRPGNLLGNLNNNAEFGFSGTSGFGGAGGVGGFSLQGKAYSSTNALANTNTFGGGGTADFGAREGGSFALAGDGTGSNTNSVERRNPFAQAGATHILGGNRRRQVQPAKQQQGPGMLARAS
jgi:hypothetical protein